jgi:hypothetical protein
MKIRPATRAEIESFYGDYAGFMDHVHAAIEGNRILAMGGLSHQDGKCWGSLDIRERPQSGVFGLVKALIRGIKAAGGPVYVQCNDDSADRFLRLIGFIPTNNLQPDMRDGTRQLRVYKWQR